MIAMDFNKMTLRELSTIKKNLQVEFIIENGKIVGTEKIPTPPTKAQ